MSDTLRGLFASDPVSRHFDDAALLAAMARFEAALAAAQADAGLVPRAAAARIEAVCTARFGPAASVAGVAAGADARTDGSDHGTRPAGTVAPADAADAADPFAPAALAAAARHAGTLAIPFVRALTEAVGREDAQAARWVHWGATSQDVADTALALAAAAAGAELQAQLARAGDALARLADAHRATTVTGRTLLQPATPVPFGWKLACWLSPLVRSRAGLAGALEAARVLQLGGASGIRAALGGRGDAVAEALAARLGLTAPEISWHGSRDRVARLGAELALLAGAMARIGRDVSLLMQGEVAEVFEPGGAGRGGSSAMPHKRNPVASMLALQAGLRAPGLVSTLLAQLPGEHERGLGTWQADWWTIGALFECAGSATAAIGEALEDLHVDADAMRANLERTGGFVYAEAVTLALAGTLGRPAAQAQMERLCRDAIDRGEPLREAIARARLASPVLAQALPEGTLDALFDPQAQRGDADAMIDGTLARWRAA
ncbi:MAG: lyase family protein [Burkholderiales bacterium]|nr:lyase family protein [Burkholderiales bacterium]